MMPDIAFATVLSLVALLAAIVGARARRTARDYLRFAAVLYAALACADIWAALANDAWNIAFAGAVGLTVAALASVALALAIAASLETPPPAIVATPLLVLACLAGILSAATGEAAIALAPLAASVCAILALAARHWRTRVPAQACVAALALLASAAAFSDGGRSACALFSAVALLGAALTAAKPSKRLVEQTRPRSGWRIGRQRGAPVGRIGAADLPEDLRYKRRA
jgi:hypothetical protein